MELRELLDKYDQGFVEVQFEDTGFFVKIKPMCQELRDKISPRIMKVRFDGKTHRKIEEIDDAKFGKAISDEALVGWRGLTVAVARRLVPTLKVPADVDPATEIPCTPDAKYMLMVRSSAFQQFALNVALDAGEIVADQEEAEAKNSETSPDGGQAETPSHATSA